MGKELKNEEPKILRLAKIRNEMYLHQGDVCDFLRSIKKGCASIDSQKHVDAMLKLFGCIDEDCSSKEK